MTDLEKNNPPKANPPQDDNFCWIMTIVLSVLLLLFLIGVALLIRGTDRPNSENSSIEGLTNTTHPPNTSFPPNNTYPPNSTYPNSTYRQTLEIINYRVDYLLDQLSGFSDINCSAIMAGDKNEIEKARYWKIPNADFELHYGKIEISYFSYVWKQIEDSDDQCEDLKQSFVFLNFSLSPEEDEFPIAYGALVYKDIEQVIYMLSSLYRPNNVFAFVVDKKASDDFKERIQLVSKCFPNVYVQVTENPVEPGKYEVVKAVFETVKILTASKLKWKYYQYISGFTMPLKTNLEMIRIYKEMNGSSDVTLQKYPNAPNESPLPLLYSSLAATFPREAAEVMVNSAKVKELLEFLKETAFPDELMWGTMLGNPDALSIPGGFNGAAAFRKLEQDYLKFNQYGDPNRTRPNSYTFVPSNYYISRYQIWKGYYESAYCKGKIAHYSCVFGVGDVKMLITRPELVAHKLYFNFEPAAYFCLYQNHWKRTLDLETQQKFNAKPYSKLALVQLKRGVPLYNVNFYHM